MVSAHFLLHTVLKAHPDRTTRVPRRHSLIHSTHFVFLTRLFVCVRMYYLSFIRYPLDFLLANELSSVEFDCSDFPNVEQCPVPIGDVLLETFGVKYGLGDRAVNFVSLWIFWLGFLVLGFLALRFINHIKR